MIKTQYDISIEIDKQTFNVTVRELTPAQRKTLETLSLDQKDALAKQRDIEKEIENNRIDIEAAQHSLEVNREILELVPLSEKLKVFIDIKKDGFEIAKLKKARLNLERVDFTKANEIYERIHKEKFNYSVFGKDKEALEKIITDSNISYQIIWDEFDKEIKSQMGKKLNASEDGLNK